MIYSYYKGRDIMKKHLKIFLIGIIVLGGCSGCTGNITRDIRHAGFSIGDTFKCKYFFPADKDDTSYKKIQYLTGNHIISTEGKLYEVSLGQKYSNDQNCKEADTQLVVKAIFDSNIIKATDNKYYYIVGQNDVKSYSEITEADNSYLIYDLLLKADDIVKVITADSSNGIYYVLRTDGNVYSYTVSRTDRNSPPAITSTSIVYSKNDYGSTIIDFNYAGESIATFVKTNEKVFRMRVTNSSECGKYADVQCTYSMQEDETLATYKDNIIAYNGSTLITDYNQIFNAAS